MFEALGQKFSSIFSGLRGKVTDTDLRDFTAQIKIALLESDVAVEVAESFSNRILEKAKLLESDINKSTNPAQKIFEIVNTELPHCYFTNWPSRCWKNFISRKTFPLLARAR